MIRSTIFTRRIATALLFSTALVTPVVVSAQATGPASPGAGTPIPGQDEEPEVEVEVPGPDPQDVPAERETEISIPGGDIVVTGRVVQDVERSSTQVVNVLSAEDIARTGEGDIAGALGRVTGLSVQGNGFVFVRGLGDRYSLALLNGLPLPSPQPLSRVVPLDIFPTSIIASSLVQKTYSANFPGEFGGGVINLTTRTIPDESFITLSGGISGDTETTFSNGLDYYGSDTDWSGFDDGTRDQPPALRQFFASGQRISDQGVDQQAIARQLGNPNLIVLQRIGEQRPNFSGGITAGTSFDVSDDGRFGIIATASLKNGLLNRVITQQTAINSDLDLDSDFTNFVTDNRILVNGLLGFGLEIGEHRFKFTNLYIRDTLKQSSLAQGEDFQSGFSEIQQDTSWFERELFDTQFVGELEFGGLAFDVRAGFAQTQREAPFEYSFEYVRTNLPNDPNGDRFVNVLDRQRGNASVVFSDLSEELYYTGLDLSYPIADWLSATVGYAYNNTERLSERREFLFDAATDFPDVVGALRPDLLLGDAVIDFFNVGLIETTQSDPAFAANLEVHAAYGLVRLYPTFGVTVELGARYEDATQTVDPVEVFETPINSSSSSFLANDYILPGGTITWEVNDQLQFRVNASKTIARPQFRELIFQTYFDPETNRQFNGNPFLLDSELTNAEARAEYYFDRDNRVSLAGFFKDIQNPIEAFSSFSDNEQLTSFANAPAATLYGAELELQAKRSLQGLGGGFFSTKDAVVIANYTFTDSEISVGPDDLTQIFPRGDQPAANFFVDGVPLTGQSDHLVNFQLGFEDYDSLQQLTLLLAYASERVTSRGTSGLPDIVEDPGLRVDVVGRQGISLGGIEMELKAEARNIFGRGKFEFQSNGTNRIEVNSFDRGTSFALSLSATL